MQNNVIRSLGEYLACGSTRDCFRDLGILNIDFIKSQQILIFVYQVLNGLSPQYFRSFVDIIQIITIILLVALIS